MNEQVAGLLGEALGRFAGLSVVPKSAAVDVLLDVRNAASDPWVSKRVDEMLRSMSAPSLVDAAALRSLLEELAVWASREPVSPMG